MAIIKAMDLHTYIQSTNLRHFAESIGVSKSYASRIVNGNRRVPAERVIEIESATGGQVTRHELRPDLYPKEKPYKQKTTKQDINQWQRTANI